ncbi:MAG: histidinol-phosphatase [Ardenticatenales bacterium]|nr:histidinol-phosphatase [Ardenticatenales bacterium]
MPSHASLRPYLDFAIDAAWQAGRLTLEYFQTNVGVEWKSDASPVTIADRRAEELLRKLIEKQYPTHAIVGEEFGETDGSNAAFRWIVDPIDGTRSFIRGVPLYAVLVGLEVEGEMVLGVANFPALNEMVSAARGEGCTWNGRPCRTSSVNRLSEALVCFTDPSAFEAHGRADAWARISAASHTQRGWSDAYGHILVATGRAEIMLDPIVTLWDNAALLPILQEAGGTFTDWNGTPTAYGGNGISTNGYLLDEILKQIKG